MIANTTPEQVEKFLTGNELVAEAAKAIHFHFMGYFPITPSTEIAQLLDKMKAKGEITTVLLAADGEHGAAGACFGASSGGGRVLSATSANGFLYSLEQLPVQAGMRLPMVLNLVTRSVSGPLDIRCDHSDLMYALQTGWIVLLASTPQAVYDMNIIAVKLGEHPDVRLPVMVVSDGFFTSHQRASAQIFANSEVVKNFLGPCRTDFSTLNPRKPVTLGPYMNDPDLINNKYQLHLAQDRALTIFDEISNEYAKLSGRHYPSVESYQMENAKTAVLLLNSAAETAKDAVDQMRSQNLAVGSIKPNILRPFPAAELKKVAHQLSSLVIGERADTPGSLGGPLSHEVRSTLASDHHAKFPALIRIYGLGGKIFRIEDAKDMLRDGLKVIEATDSAPAFAFMGLHSGTKAKWPSEVLPPLTKSEVNMSLTSLAPAPANSKKTIEAKVADTAKLTNRPKRIAPGHSACPGCGIFSGLDQFFKGLDGDVVVLYHTGCAMVVTTDYPFSAHRVSYIHNLFQNGAPTLSGLVEMFYERQRRGEISIGEEITFVMVTGDGGMDIGMGPTIGTALRNHNMIILEYDNQGYMNTGGQLSYTTPFGKASTTSHIGKTSFGKTFHHKDTAEIMAATGIPYIFTAIESTGTDLVEKAAKAQWFSKNHGLAFGKILVACPLNWESQERLGSEILQMAADCCFFPIYEIQLGLTTLNYNPELENKKMAVSNWLEQMGKSKHLLLPENEKSLSILQQEIDRRWARLKARAESPLL